MKKMKKKHQFGEKNGILKKARKKRKFMKQIEIFDNIEQKWKENN